MASTPPASITGTAPATVPHPVCNRLEAACITRDTLAADFQAVRAATEALAEPLDPEEQNLQSMTQASPVKWHRAHTSWFFETFVLEALGNDWQAVDPSYRYLFNSYYHGVGAQYPRARRSLISRPNCAAVGRYRRRIDEAVLALIEACPASHWPRLATLLRLGLNHEQQHQELMVTDLKHALSWHPDHPGWTALPEPSGQDAAALEWIGFDASQAEIGAGADAVGGFCFDNETPRHRVLLTPFELASRPVNCAEYLDFIDDGGYHNPRLWLSDGWAWRESEAAEAPLYWQQLDGTWYLHTSGGLRALDPAETLAHISFYEANAFATWAGARLPTEAEWEHAAARAGPAGHLAESARWHPGAARPAPEQLSAMFGDVWEWTASSYSPYPGFRPLAGTVGEYNGKFMVNQMVLRGGSCASPAAHLRASYRNFFSPGDRWQFSGLRLARQP